MSLLLKNFILPLAPFALELEAELRGPITVLFGPSGAGKTSLLDTIAGLRRPSSAFIQLHGRVLQDTSRGVFLPTHQRRIGYVPQDLALFPHLSVRQNLLYGAKSAPAADPLFSFNHIVEILEIQPLINRGVSQLSGGEQQRVALARALLASPQLLLLDEPLANLDLSLKRRILPYLARIRDEFRLPMLYVTHDRHELLALADEMVVLVNGKIAQIGSAQEILNRPATLAVAGLLTVETIQPGRILKSADDLVNVSVGTAHLLSTEAPPLPDSTDIYVCIRAEDVILLQGADASGSARNRLPGAVRSLASEGPHVRVELDCGFPLTALITKQAAAEMELKPGRSVTALIKAPHVHLVPR